MDEILQINNLNYNTFSHFNLSIKNEKYISIIGSNNSGKTTLLRIISGIIPTSSVVTCYGIDLSRQNINRYIKQLGVVCKYTNNSFLFTSVYEEMSYPLKNLGYCDRYIKKSISKILNLFSLNISDKNINDLTEYEKQALLFCIALLHQPKLLLIDNVFAHMKQEDCSKIISILKKIKRLSIINFSCNLENIEQSDYIYVLDKYKISLEGDYQYIIKNITKLKKMGIEIPFVINLCSRLKEHKLITSTCNKIDDLVDALWK